MPDKANEARRHKIPRARYRIETGLMLRLAFGRPWRQTEGLLGSILGLLGLELPVPDHTRSLVAASTWVS